MSSYILLSAMSRDSVNINHSNILFFYLKYFNITDKDSSLNAQFNLSI